MSDIRRVGYSNKINDPAFQKYIRNSNRWSVVFSVGLAIAAVVGFTIYGESSSEMDNPQAFFIGLGIGAMFLLIALLQILGRKKSKTWDGTVVDKYVRKRRRKRKDQDDGYENYEEYTVVVKSQEGKIVKLTAEDDDTRYNYFQIGDRVRHHKGLNSFEKYDKSNDSIVFCNACASLNDIKDDFCFRCKCPLLK